MALNDNYSGNKSGGSYGNKEDKRPQTYSSYSSMYNIKGVDPSRISIDYFSNVLKISIAPMNKTSGDSISFDYNNAISIFLRQNEARILCNEILNFINDPIKFNNSGIVTRSGMITVDNGKDHGTNNPCVVIRKIDENGAVASAYLYECNTESMYSIRNYNDKKNTFDKVTVDYTYTELYHIIEHLEQYLKGTTSAMAHSIIDNSRFINNRLNTKIDAIAASMNIRFDRKGGNKGNYSGGDSYFNNAPATNYSSSSGSTSGGYESGTLDDLD